MSYETIIYQKEDGLGIITLNRPDKLNALSSTLLSEVGQAIKEIRNDDSVKVVILTGGPRSDGRPWFSAGADLKEIAGRDTKAVPILRREANGILNSIEDLPKPTIAAIDGLCTTGALELVLVFDMRFAGTALQMSDWHLKNLGRTGGWGLPVRLCRLIGPSKAKEMIYTGGILNAEEALRIGLVNRVYPSDKLMEETKKVAREIAAMPPLGLEINKVCVDMATHLDLHQAINFTEWQRTRFAPTTKAAASFLTEKGYMKQG